MAENILFSLLKVFFTSHLLKCEQFTLPEVMLLLHSLPCNAMLVSCPQIALSCFFELSANMVCCKIFVKLNAL